MNLQEYISQAFPQGLPYNDAAQLCLQLYRTVDDIPRQFHEQCTKDNLAEVFARLVDTGTITGQPLTAAIYGANFHSPKDKGHWIEVIASIFSKGDTVDMERGKTLAKRLTTSL